MDVWRNDASRAQGLFSARMRRYANPADEGRIQHAISKAVCAGESVATDDKGQLPPDFAAYAVHEVAICASDMIVDRLLIPVGENENSVWVINASNGGKPTRVIPAKGLHSMCRDMKQPTPNFWQRNRDAIWLHVIKYLLSALIGGLIVWFLK